VLEPFQLPYFQRGLVEILILAVASGLLGTWIVLRGLAFFSHATGTASFPGLVLADGLGFAAPLGAFAAAALFGGGTWALSRRRGTSYDSLTAMVLVGCLAAGVILASDVFHSASGVEQLLFGSLLLVDGRDLALAGGTAGAALCGTLLLGPRWLAAGFDDASGSAWRRESRLTDLLLLGLIALATTAALTVIGALLVTALFVAPAATVRPFVRRMRGWQLASVLLAALEGTVGLWLSVQANAPPGAAIATLAGGVFGVMILARAAARTATGRRAVAAAGAAIAITLLAGCGSSLPDSSGKPLVVVTTTQLGDFARQLAGGRMSVHQILSPNTDPHDYEPRPDDVAAVAGADLVLASGDGLDSWIGRVVDDSGSRAPVVELGDGVPVRRDTASGLDPHWWHDPRNAEAAVREIASRMSAVDPAAAGAIEARAASYLRRLRALDAGIHRCMEAIPAARRKLVTDHDAFGYFAARYGIEVVGAVIPSQTTQAEPSAGDLSSLIELIRSQGVRAVFPESSLSSKLADTVARETGASSDYTLYGDTLGPDGSSGDTYLGMEHANAEAMARGFTGGRRGCPIAGLGR
jgi:zinc/manganese transport system substrate-binding protein